MNLGVLEGQTRGYYFLDSIFSISVKQHNVHPCLTTCLLPGDERGVEVHREGEVRRDHQQEARVLGQGKSEDAF